MVRRPHNLNEIEEAVSELDDSIADLNENINQLINHEKRSSAIETLFTVAIMFFSLTQIVITVPEYFNYENFGPLVILRTTMAVFIIVLVLTVGMGSENLIHEIKKEIKARPS